MKRKKQTNKKQHKKKQPYRNIAVWKGCDWMLNLSSIPTCQLVEELLKREGVEHKKVEPYADCQITANGPAILIKVID